MAAIAKAFCFGHACAIAYSPVATCPAMVLMADIHATLSKGDRAARQAVELVRKLIDRIVVTPTDDGEPMKLELVGNVAALLEEQPLNGGAILAVAGPRNYQSSSRG